jgi:hypothetical protein
MKLTTLALAAVAMATGAMARRKLVGAKSQAILEVLSRGRFTADRISALQNDTGTTAWHRLILSQFLCIATYLACFGVAVYVPSVVRMSDWIYFPS